MKSQTNKLESIKTLEQEYEATCRNQQVVADTQHQQQSLSQENKPQSQPLNLKVCRQVVENKQQSNDDDNRCFPVQKAIEWHHESEEIYRMSAKQRGLCLIINNIEFENELLQKRKGSDMDAYRFRKIFTQLGFSVDAKRNLTADKMKSHFKQVSARCSSKHDALVVILLSHGTESGVYGQDALEVDLNDILTNFDNKRCRQMIGKPKVFIVQACRGRKSDYGVRNDSQSFFSQPDTQGFTQPSQSLSDSPKISRWAEIDNNNHPTRTDMVLCFSCHTGFVSTRNEAQGSWLGASLATHLQAEARRKHLMEIFNMVSRDVRKMKSSDGHKQVLEITSIGFDRNLYFNPGLFRQDN